MPISGEAANETGNAITRGTKPANEIKWVSIGKTEKEVSVETETAASGKKFKKTAHGLNSGDIVVITELNTKTGFGETVGGLIVGQCYYAHKVEANEFAIAHTKSQSESATEGEWVEYTAAIKTSTKFAKVIEATIKERKEVPFAAAANRFNEYATAVEVESTEASQKIKWVMYWNQQSKTTPVFMAIETTTEKELQNTDLFKLTNQKIEQTAVLT